MITFRADEETKEAIDRHASSISSNRTDAMKDIIQMLISIGQLSFMNAKIGDGNNYRVIELHSSVVLMLKDGKKYVPAITYSRIDFCANFVIYSGMLVHTDTFNGAMPEDAYFLEIE